MSNGISAEALDNLLALKTPPEEVEWKRGHKAHGGDCDKPVCRQPHMELAYIDARYVMRVLDSALVGPGNWQRVHTIGEGGKVACGIGILVDGTWVWKWDGAGETDIEGEKGSFSDSFKRAGVNWGIGRDLYEMKPRPSGATATQPPAVQAQAAGGTFPPIGSNDLTAGLDGEPPVCPYHHKPATRSRFPDKKTGIIGWYCQSKASDGSPENGRGYCAWTA